jgi:hypothetical protein
VVAEAHPIDRQDRGRSASTSPQSPTKRPVTLAEIKATRRSDMVLVNN